MMNRRVFLGSALTAVALSQTRVARAAEQKAVVQTPEPLVWPVIIRQAGIRSFAGHTNTVLDIVGRIGTAPSLVIFSEGNHLMALLSEEIVGAFPTWAKAQPQYADLNLENVVVVTMPQPIVVQMVRTGAIALGSLTLDVNRASGLYPDIVMGGPAPLQELRKLAVLEPQARYFSKNRGRALLVLKGNPLGIHGLADVARTGARVAQADSGGGGSASRQPRCDRRSDRKSGGRCLLRKRGRALPRPPGHYSSGCTRDARSRLCGRRPHAVPSHFLLDADVPQSFRAGTHSWSGAVSRRDRLWSHH